MYFIYSDCFVPRNDASDIRRHCEEVHEAISNLCL